MSDSNRQSITDAHYRSVSSFAVTYQTYANAYPLEVCIKLSRLTHRQLQSIFSKQSFRYFALNTDIVHYDFNT